MDRKQLTLGSLFDGSGGFPLGGIIAGIRPVWACEVEPFPVRVTTKRLPGMKHYGDIGQMDGAEAEPADIITFGSPCQDLSVAGKRDGLGGSKSSLFFEAVRVIREMRKATHDRYPKYIVWENVPGAFSSNGGDDFRLVLENICKIKNPSASVPASERWNRAGIIVGDDFSLAWRVLDAQYWGVPQRRKRVFLVADLDGPGAGKILFEFEGVSKYSHESFKAWQKASGSSGKGPETAGDICLNDQGGLYMNVTEDFASTLTAQTSSHPPSVLRSVAFSGKSATLAASDGGQSGQQLGSPERNFVASESSSGCPDGGGEYRIRKLTPTECARLQGFPDWWCSGLGTPDPDEEEIAFWRNVFETHRKAVTKGTRRKSDRQIRKWLADPRSDYAEYRMWGNGVALPCVVFVLSAVAYYACGKDGGNDGQKAQ